MATSNTNILTALGAQQIDTQALITNLVAAQKQPRQDSIDADKKKTDSAISNIALLKNALNNLQTAATAIGGVQDLNKVNVSSSNSNSVTASPSGTGTATPGAVSVTVKALASPQRTIGTAVSDGSFPLTQDAGFTVSQGSTSLAIAVKSGMTMAQAKNSINDQLAKAGLKISCSVINNGKAAPLGPNLFVLEGQYGKDQQFSVSIEPGQTGAEQLGLGSGQTTNVSTAKNSLITLNGINGPDGVIGVDIERPTNTISDVVPGLSLQLNNVSPNEVVQVTTSVDTTAIAAGVINYVF